MLADEEREIRDFWIHTVLKDVDDTFESLPTWLQNLLTAAAVKETTYMHKKPAIEHENIYTRQT